MENETTRDFLKLKLLFFQESIPVSGEAPVCQTTLILPRHGLRSLLHDSLRLLDVLLVRS